MTTVISLGAGVQSTTLLLMSASGALPRADMAIFADTGWEPAGVYRHLEWLEREVGHIIPIERVAAGNIRAALVSNGSQRLASPPLFVKNADGSASMLRRQCTREYKVQPIYRRLRALDGPRPINLWIGISLDEVQRMKPARVRYVENLWPLIDARMTRHDCVRWLAQHGYPEAPKSACIGCPFKDDRRWRGAKLNDPEGWSDAVAVDRAIRHLPRINGETFLHSSLLPLDQVDFRSVEDRGQLPLLLDECEGMCGV